MAFSDLGSLGTGGNKTAGNSLSFNTAAAAAIGDLVVVQVVTDNAANTNGTTSTHTSVTCGNNVFTKVAEETRGGGGAAAGVTVSVWRSELTEAIASGAAVQANFSFSPVAKGMSARRFGRAAGSALAYSAAVVNNSTSAPSSTQVSGLDAAKQSLVIRAGGAETKTASFTGATDATWTLTADAGSTGGGGDNTHVSTMAEFKIGSAASFTSLPAGASVDRATIMFAITETPPPALTVQAATSASTTDSPTLVPKTLLAPAAAASASLATSPTLTLPGVGLVPSAATSAGSLEAPTLAPRTTLAVAAATSASAAATPTLATQVALAPLSAASASLAAAPTLSPRTQLAPAAASSASQAAEPTLGVGNGLGVAAAVSSSLAPALTLSPRTALNLAAAVSASQAGAVVLLPQTALAVASAVSQAQAQGVTLAPRTQLLVATALSASLATHVSLGAPAGLDPAASVSASLLGSPTLSSRTTLAANDAVSASRAEHIEHGPPYRPAPEKRRLKIGGPQCLKEARQELTGTTGYTLADRVVGSG